jgi:hypothetical protein
MSEPDISPTYTERWAHHGTITLSSPPIGCLVDATFERLILAARFDALANEARVALAEGARDE